MTNSSATRHAVILSGGGAHGAYEVGVMKALLKRGALEPDIYTGTSVGAFNAAVMVSQTNAGASALNAVGFLEEKWRGQIVGDSRGNGVFRLRGNPLPYLNPYSLIAHPMTPIENYTKDSIHLAWELSVRLLHFVATEGSLGKRAVEFSDLSNYISTEPFHELVRDSIEPDHIRRGPRQLRIAATALRTGKLRVFENGDMRDGTGYAAVIASASIPAVFPPQQVGDLGSFIDGAVRMNTPLKPAIEAARKLDAKEPRLSPHGLTLHVIVLDPTVSDMEVPKPHNTISMFNRLYAMLMGHAAERDIREAKRINDAVHTRQIVDQVLEEFPQARDALGQVSQRTSFLKAIAGAKRELTIHRYRPARALGGVLGLLDFSKENVERLIEQGLQDGTDHDCAKEECVLCS